MAYLTPFPCHICHEPDVHKNVTHTHSMNSDAIFFSWFFKLVLKKLVVRINANVQDLHINNEEIQFRFFTEKECNMGRSLIKLVMHLYDKDSQKINVSNVKNLDDIASILNKKLETISEKYITASDDPFEILSGKTTYQRYVVDCLFFTAKLTAQCIDRFEKKKQLEIFDYLCTMMYYNFKNNYIIETLVHDIQRMEPFGIVSDAEIPFPYKITKKK